MLAKTFVEYRAWRCIKTEAALSRACRHGLPYVYRDLELSVSVRLSNGSVSWKDAGVVDRVDARPIELLLRRQGLNRARQKCIGHADTKVFLVQRVVGRLLFHWTRLLAFDRDDGRLWMTTADS